MDIQESEVIGDINCVSETVTSRITTELILEVRYMLRSMGVALDGATLMLGDNMSVVLNTTVPSSFLKKKQNTIAYHGVKKDLKGGNQVPGN
jgi:hypothetical protein